jgi:hypothetical protein
MDKKLARLEEVIIGNKENSYRIARLVKKGELKKIASKIYTSNLEDDAEKIIRRNYLTIIKVFFPGAIISHRSAIETRPTKTGFFFLSYKRNQKLELPGLTIVGLRSSMSTEGASNFMGNLYISGRERAYLENLQESRRSSAELKTLGQEEVERKLDTLCRIQGEEVLNEIRDNARPIAKALSLEKEFEILNKIISAILSTHPASVLISSEARARSSSMSFDPERIERLGILYDYLSDNEFAVRTRNFSTNQEFEIQCFFEAYFSNYIEGTRFAVSEAREIVFEGKIPKDRPDAHDILGTFQLLNDKSLLKVFPTNPEEFITHLKYFHSILMRGHPHLQPGSFKEKRNQAGSTLFVEPTAVRGTLIKGLENFYLIQDPLKQAIYLMFLIAEVHPFDDGNGRMARLFMNRLLYNHGIEKIIVPNVYRDDYMGSLKKLTRLNDPGPFVRAMMRCHEFSSKIDYSSFESATLDLKASNAFLEPTEGKLFII